MVQKVQDIYLLYLLNNAPAEPNGSVSVRWGADSRTRRDGNHPRRA